jgi:hypothetical protein
MHISIHVNNCFLLWEEIKTLNKNTAFWDVTHLVWYMFTMFGGTLMSSQMTARWHTPGTGIFHSYRRENTKFNKKVQFYT